MQINLVPRARCLRKQLTAAERKLWSELRRHQFGGLRFRRQVPIGAYIIDFACFDPKLVIEVDGSQHMQAVDYDNERTKYLESLGYTVLRFWNNEVLNEIDVVKEAIWNICFKPPLPFLPPVGEGTS